MPFGGAFVPALVVPGDSGHQQLRIASLYLSQEPLSGIAAKHRDDPSCAANANLRTHHDIRETRCWSAHKKDSVCWPLAGIFDFAGNDRLV